MRFILIGEDAIERARLGAQLGDSIIAQNDDSSVCLWLAQQHRPDLILIDAEEPSAALLEVIGILHDRSLAPVLLCTATANAERVEQAIDAGVTACAPRSCSSEILRLQIQLATARWRETRQLVSELDQARERYDNRVVIEKAKGLLMESRPGLREADAYAQMRRLSMSERTPLPKIAAAIILTNALGTSRPPGGLDGGYRPGDEIGHQHTA